MTKLLQLLDYNPEKSIVDFVAFNGPRIIAVITSLRLFTQFQYLIAYIVSKYADSEINKILKNVIREERPSNGENYANERYVGAHVYGMPSGHAQSVFFSVVFLYLATRSNILLLLTGSIAVLTLLQRWISRKHTVAQLIAGSVVGAVNAFLAYKITKRFIETKKTPIF